MHRYTDASCAQTEPSGCVSAIADGVNNAWNKLPGSVVDFNSSVTLKRSINRMD